MDAFLFLLTPRSVERPWVWYEAGAAWFSDKRRIHVATAGLDRGDIPYPLGAIQTLQIDQADDAVHFFKDFGATLDGVDSFIPQIHELGNVATKLALTQGGWESIDLNDRHFAWRGPLHKMNDRTATVAPPGLLPAIDQMGLVPTWGSEDRLAHHLQKGRLQVFETDLVEWKRPIIESRQSGNILLVRLPEPTIP